MLTEIWSLSAGKETGDIMKMRVINFIYRFTQLFAVVFISDRLEMNFWAKFGILVVLFLVFDGVESFFKRFCDYDDDFEDKN